MTLRMILLLATACAALPIAAAAIGLYRHFRGRQDHGEDIAPQPTPQPDYHRA